MFFLFSLSDSTPEVKLGLVMESVFSFFLRFLFYLHKIFNGGFQIYGGF